MKTANAKMRHYKNFTLSKGSRPIYQIAEAEVAAAAAFEAFTRYEKMHRATDKGRLLKLMLIVLAAAAVDKFFETLCLDRIDKEKTHHQARKAAEHLYESKYRHPRI